MYESTLAFNPDEEDLCSKFSNCNHFGLEVERFKSA